MSIGVVTAKRANPAAGSTPLGVYHPVFRLGELVELASDRLTVAATAAEETLADALIDAYLAVASACQVLGDHTHRDVGDLGRIRKYASRIGAPAGKLAAGGLRVVERGVRAVAGPRDRATVESLAHLQEFALTLADRLWGIGETGTAQLRDSFSSIATGHKLPTGRIAIPPRCFFTFDQRPEDCLALARRFAETRRRRGPVVVVGVRTSGCFLAPIVAAGLRRAGCHEVTWMSWRPGQPVLGIDARMFSHAGPADVLIVDDPPTSGASFARTAEEIAALGVPAPSITLALPLFPGRRGWEKRLARWPQVRLEWQDWSVHAILEESSVSRAISALTDWDVVACVRMGGANGSAATARSHIRATYRLRVATDGDVAEHAILATGAGVGLFGQATLSAGRRLEPFVPRIYGLLDGILYRESLPPAALIDGAVTADSRRLARAIADYAAARASRLPVERDSVVEISGHDAAWEQAARWFGIGFGRLALAMRPLLHAAGRRLMRSPAPSLIDGAMGEGQWFAIDGRVLKQDFAEAAFVYQLPMSYDATYDVAAAATLLSTAASNFGAEARADFESSTDRRIDDVRWFLNQLVAELDHRDAVLRGAIDGPPDDGVVELVTNGERAFGALHRSFLATQLLAEASLPSTGEIVAIDIDGVLESGPWWYAAPSAASLMAVRALLMHGYRPVIATGRSQAESALRCHDYRLAGAVAEYGCAVYDSSRDEQVSLLRPDDVADMRCLREALGRMKGVHLDPAYTHAVRAFALKHGARAAIPDVLAEEALKASGAADRIRVERGWAQTDFVPIEVDKRTGLQALLARIGDGGPSLAMAIGDSTADLPMFRLARLKVVPANAAPGLERSSGAVRCSGVGGAGLAQAVRLLIGHRPGACAQCRVQRAHDATAELALSLLAAADARGVWKLASAARAATLLRRL